MGKSEVMNTDLLQQHILTPKMHSTQNCDGANIRKSIYGWLDRGLHRGVNVGRLEINWPSAY